MGQIQFLPHIPDSIKDPYITFVFSIKNCENINFELNPKVIHYLPGYDKSPERKFSVRYPTSVKQPVSLCSIPPHGSRFLSWSIRASSLLRLFLSQSSLHLREERRWLKSPMTYRIEVPSWWFSSRFLLIWSRLWTTWRLLSILLWWLLLMLSRRYDFGLSVGHGLVQVPTLAWCCGQEHRQLQGPGLECLWFWFLQVPDSWEYHQSCCMCVLCVIILRVSHRSVPRTSAAPSPPVSPPPSSLLSSSPLRATLMTQSPWITIAVRSSWRPSSTSATTTKLIFSFMHFCTYIACLCSVFDKLHIHPFKSHTPLIFPSAPHLSHVYIVFMFWISLQPTKNI